MGNQDTQIEPFYSWMAYITSSMSWLSYGATEIIIMFS